MLLPFLKRRLVLSLLDKNYYYSKCPDTTASNAFFSAFGFRLSHSPQPFLVILFLEYIVYLPHAPGTICDSAYYSVLLFPFHTPVRLVLLFLVILVHLFLFHFELLVIL